MEYFRVLYKFNKAVYKYIKNAIGPDMQYAASPWARLAQNVLALCKIFGEECIYFPVLLLKQICAWYLH